MRLPFRRLLPLFLAASAAAHAQGLYFVEGSNWSNIAKPPKKAVIADITATLTAQTPWGPFTTTETGKYWRSRDGKVRQDSEYGLSTMADLSTIPRSITYIDHDLHRIALLVDRVPFGRASFPSEDSTGADFTFSGPPSKPKKSGQDVLEEFKVTIRKGLWNGWPYEIWTADELKMILLLKVTSNSGEFVQRYHDIRLEEPNPSLFELPPGYRMTTFRNLLGARCLREEVSISGEPQPTDVIPICP